MKTYSGFYNAMLAVQWLKVQWRCGSALGPGEAERSDSAWTDLLYRTRTASAARESAAKRHYPPVHSGARLALFSPCVAELP